MMKPPLKQLIFDCDGVLVDTESVVIDVAAKAIAKLFPQVNTTEVFAATFGQQIESVMGVIEDEYQVLFPGDFCDQLNAQVNEALQGSDIAIPNIHEAFLAIKTPVAVVSNSHRGRLALSVESAGLETFLGPQYQFSADDVEHPKPAPDVYLYAASKLGVKPQECLVVEDSLAGITAATNAGMTVLAFMGASHIPIGHEEAVKRLGVARVFFDMAELPPLVGEYVVAS